VTRLWPEGETIQTWGDDETPAGFVWRNGPCHIEKVYNRWRLQTRWWEVGKSVAREYLKVTTDNGLLCLLYRDLNSGDWFLARVYD